MLILRVMQLERPRVSRERCAQSSTVVRVSPQSYHLKPHVVIWYLLDYSQCLPGTATSTAATSSPSNPPTGLSGLPRFGGVNTAGYDFSVVGFCYCPLVGLHMY